MSTFNKFEVKSGNRQTALGSRQERDSVEKITSLFHRDPTSRALAIAVKCCQCKTAVGNQLSAIGKKEEKTNSSLAEDRLPKADSVEDAIRGCKEKKCALHALRPFQQDVEPASAPHVELALSDEERLQLRKGNVNDD